MNRILKVVSALALVVSIAACKDDNNVYIEPVRDYGVQYIADKAAIEYYLQTHYIASVSEDYDVEIQEISDGLTVESIWDQDAYPLQSKIVNSNGVDYTVYYLMLREGAGENPSKFDNVKVAYRGTLLDGTQFDYSPFPQNPNALGSTIVGWQEIIPLFKTGIEVEIPNDPNPASYTDFGAGVMFLPSGLAYFNSSPSGTVPAYSPMVFSFKVYDMDRLDHDNDGIYSVYETVPGTDPLDYDTDGDGVANYIDGDDDNDGVPTKTEITDPATGQLYSVIPGCNGGTTPKHLDPACH